MTACEAGGKGVEGASGSPGYVYFGAATAQQFTAAHFLTANADPSVVDTTASLRNRDPCGDIQSYEAAAANSLAHLGEIDVPVLTLTGGNDAIYPVPASEQASLFTGTDDVTAVTVTQTGHALTLHNSADEFRGEVGRELARRPRLRQRPVTPANRVDTGGDGASTTSSPGGLLVGGAGALVGAAGVAAG